MEGGIRDKQNFDISKFELHGTECTFKTIQTPATKEFEQGNLNVKRTILQPSNCTQQAQLITGMKEFRTFGNPRHFYCLQVHTTSNNTQWGKTMRRLLLLRPTVPRMLAKTPETSAETTARDATLAQTISEAVAREMAKAHVHYQAILNERGAATL